MKAPRLWRPAVAGITAAAVVATGVTFLMVRDTAPPRVDANPYSPPPIAPPPPDPDEVFLNWGPSEGDLARALETARAMPLEEVAGLVIVARFGGTSEGGLDAHIREYHLGGVILGTSSIQSAEQVTALTGVAQAAAAADGRDWPFILATDQEGGRVARLDGVIPTMPTFLASGAAHDKNLVEDAFAGMGRDMATLGFNVDFAPVADLTIGLADPIIRSRSPGDDPDEVSETVVAAVAGLVDAGVVPSVKHFPGHGHVTTDSHASTPYETRTLKEMEETGLVPFRVAIDAGAPMVMMSHVAVSAWGNVPATIDPLAYDYLREELGFTGVAITDSMGMGALLPYGGTGQNTVAALNAGADLILMPAVTAEAYSAIVEAVTNGTLSRERLDEAASRVIALMRYQASIDPAVDVEGDYVRALSQTSVTVVTPLCGTPLVGPTVTISGGRASERAALANALAEYGVTIGGGTSIYLVTTPDGTGTADVVVAMDGPWGLSSSTATTYIGLYGRGPSSLAALADVLVGAVVPRGDWPVDVPGLPYDPCPSPR